MTAQKRHPKHLATALYCNNFTDRDLEVSRERVCLASQKQSKEWTQESCLPPPAHITPDSLAALTDPS